MCTQEAHRQLGLVSPEENNRSVCAETHAFTQAFGVHVKRNPFLSRLERKPQRKREHAMNVYESAKVYFCTYFMKANEAFKTITFVTQLPTTFHFCLFAF